MKSEEWREIDCLDVCDEEKTGLHGQEMPCPRQIAIPKASMSGHLLRAGSVCDN